MTEKHESLADAIEKYLDKPASKIPSKLRKRIANEFPISWDGLSDGQRREMACQIDLQRDSSRRDIQEDALKRGFERVQIKKRLDMYKWRAPEKSSSEETKRMELVAKLEGMLSDLETAPSKVESLRSRWIEISPPQGSRGLADLLYRLVNDLELIPQTREDWARLLLDKFGGEYGIKSTNRTGESIIYNEKAISHGALNIAITRLKSHIKKQQTEQH